ncbi:uncharacterized protein [Dysidea avara]|uniref:uncharacterized protein n=1 Tax=Dysidea avara TaxID=196820 RepID=UPI00331CD008
MRADESDSLLPAKHMPMGLIEHTINFFNAEHVNELKCPPDYRLWLETMYNLFGTKWCRIFSGPMWSYVSIAQSEAQSNESAITKEPSKALVNIPAISERTLQRSVEYGDFTIGTNIQTMVLEKVAKINPGVHWWLKGDGTDIVKGLWQSTSGEWSGDVDLNDGKLQQEYNRYKLRMEAIDSVGLHKSLVETKSDLSHELDVIKNELKFVSQELQTANTAYEEKLKDGSRTDQTMFNLSWDVEELKWIFSEGRGICGDIHACIEHCTADLFQLHNVPNKLTSIRSRLLQFVKRVEHFKRVPASHVFVLMISAEQRNRKPYAVPVQCVPYAGLKEKDIRNLVSALCRQMIQYGMKVSGFVSDGEFNYLRTKGYTRPLSVLQIRCHVRNKYSRLSRKRLLAMLTPRRLANGTITTEHDDVVVPSDTLNEMWEWRMNQHVTMEDVVDRLRGRTVPNGYTYCNWKQGKTESFED